MTRAMAMLFPMLPFMFGLMRAVESDGTDMRYLWVALAAFAGGMLRLGMARSKTATPITRGALAAGVFVISSLFAAVAAAFLGTKIGPAMFLVAAGFGACFALGAYASMTSARR